MSGANCVRKWPSFTVILVCCVLKLCAGQTLSECGRKEKVQMTVMLFKPQNSESMDPPLPHYECYLGAGDGDATVLSSRPYRTRNFVEPPPSSPIPSMNTNLPTDTAAYEVSLTLANNAAFGVYTCDASKGGRQNTSVFNIFLHSDGYIVQSNQLFTKTVSVGDTGVTIDMTVVKPEVIPPTSQMSQTPDIRWRINGSASVDSPGGGGDYVNEDYNLLSSRGISVDDEGVYEPHGWLVRNGQNALQRLIVRSCSVGKWGPPGCNGICDNCYNGGVCDDETGRCICPPGFMGTNCLTACGANKFGYSCEFQCDYEGTGGCVGRQFCLLDPYGCTCNTGYKNLDCMTECEAGRFGAGCLQQCHCAGSNRCDRFSGECDSGNCQDGWSGTNCQIPDDCPDGYYGSDCTQKCLCQGGMSCDKNTGECSNGAQCAPGSMKPAGSVKCQECPNRFYGDCSEECHCASDACDKATGECVGCCKPQWLDTDSNTCQTGLEGSSFSKVNSGQPTTVRCEASQGIAYSIELSREKDTLDTSGITGSSTFIRLNSQVRDFTINNVSSTDVFYCLLVSGSDPVAWLSTTVSAYELPVLTDPPTSLSQTNDSVTIRWRAWDAAVDVGDPPIVWYITYYKEMGGDVWRKGSIVSSVGPLEFTASDLKMNVNYTLSVAAVREGDGGEGPRGPPVTVKTLCRAPPVPTNVQASLTDDNQVQVSWQIPPGNVTCSTGIISFTIYAQIEGSSDEPMPVATAGGDTSSSIISDELEVGKNYVFYVSLTTDQESARSTRSEAVVYPGPPSPVLIIVIIIIVIVLAIVIILVLVVFRRYFCGTGSQDKAKPKEERVDSAIYTNAGTSGEPGGYTTLELDSKESSKNSEYYHHLHQYQNERTMSEYEETGRDKMPGKGKGLEYEDVGNMKQGRNKLPKPPESKNNHEILSEDNVYEEPDDFENYTGVYINIPKTNKQSLPEPIKVSEFQRFMQKNKKELVEGIVKEFMDHKGKVTFIAAQGPVNKYKIGDFWRMVWQEKVKTIVMLQTDANQTASAAYWPVKVKTNETHGEITVVGVESTNYGTYTVRKMKLLTNDNDRIHTVQQVQLHVWPFRGVPEDITDLIAIIKKVKLLQGGGGTIGPLLVHCSNGSGATGAFIAIYNLMDVLNQSKTISVFDFVRNMRKERMDMVQMRIQYLFIYETLQAAQLFPEDSSLSCAQLKNLSDRSLNRKAEKEFKVLREVGEHSRQMECKVGTLTTNAHKNRFKDIIPLDKYRATLKSEGLSHGSSDYINATLAENIGSRYTIMTQSPLPATVEDFWRLVYDYQCSTIIMLDNTNSVDKTVVQYWPDGKATYISITVELVSTVKADAFTQHTFTVTHQDFEESVSVDQLVFNGFGNNKEVDVDNLAKFIGSIQNDATKTLVVHCINGVGLSAVCVVVRSQMESVRKGGEFDVFLAVQKLRMRNPHAIQTQDEYVLCLQLLRSLLNNQEEYAVVY